MHIAEDTIREMYDILDIEVETALEDARINIKESLDDGAIRFIIRQDVFKFALLLMRNRNVDRRGKLTEISNILYREISEEEFYYILCSPSAHRYYDRENKIPEFLYRLVDVENDIYRKHHYNCNICLKLSMCLLNMAKNFILESLSCRDNYIEGDDDNDIMELGMYEVYEDEDEDVDSTSIMINDIFFNMEKDNYTYIETYMNDILKYLNSNLDTMENTVPVLLGEQDIVAPKKGK